MEDRVKHAAALLMLALCLGACADQPFMGTWTIERADPAPWVDATFVPDQEAAAVYVGQTVTFAPDRIEAPALLACTNPTYAFVDVSAAGMFQGGLSDNAATAVARAKALGFGANVATLKTSCEHDIASTPPSPSTTPSTGSNARGNSLFCRCRAVCQRALQEGINALRHILADVHMEQRVVEPMVAASLDNQQRKRGRRRSVAG
jgi:hypothetical protein